MGALFLKRIDLCQARVTMDKTPTTAEYLREIVNWPEKKKEGSQMMAILLNITIRKVG